MSRAAEDIALPVWRRINDEPRVFHAAKEGLQSEVYLQARGRTAEARGESAGPTEVLVVPAFWVEFVRVGKPARIAVRCTVNEEDRRTFRDDRSRDLDVGQSGPAGKELNRRLEAQDLLDGAGDQLRPAAQKFEGPGVPQHSEHAVGDRVDRGIMTGDE